MAVPEAIQSALELAWASFNLFSGGALACYLSQRSMDGVDWSFAWTLTAPLVTEGVAALCKSLGPKDSDILDTTFFAWQVSVHAPWLLASVYYLYAYDRTKSLKRVLVWCYGIGALFGIVAIALHGNDELQWMMATSCLEVVLLLRLLYSTAYCVAANRINVCREVALKKHALVTMVVQILSYANHMYHILTLLNPGIDSIGRIVASRVFSGAVVVAMSYLAVKMCELRGYSPPDALGGSAWSREQPFLRLEVEAQRRFAISSDRLWSWSYVCYFAAYGFSASCFLLITKPDLRRDPIVRMYKTVHPCILLDYLPGTLFAQPIFDLQILCISLAMHAAFVRHIIEGRYFRIFVGAAAACLFAMTGTIFQLVFTLNPSEVSVLAHSIPYMIWIAGVMMFMFSEAFAVLHADGWRKHPAFMVYVCFTFSTMAYGEWFLLDKFLRNWSAVSKPASASDLTDAPDDFEWDHKPLIGSIVLVVLLISWYKFSPRALTGLAFSIHLSAGAVAAEEADEEDARARGSLGGSLSISAALKTAVLFATFSIGLGTYLNGAVHGDVLGWSQNLATLPGSAVIATGWVPTITSLAVYALGTVYYQLHCNPSKVAKVAVVIFGALLVCTALTAHGATIPGTDHERYHGASAFAMAWALWLVVDCALLLQVQEQISPRDLTQQLAAALLCIGLLIYRTIVQSVYVDFGILGSLILWALTDARKVKLVFSDAQLTKVDHGAFPPLWTIAREA